MCNLYNISTNREAITRLTRALDRAGWNEPSRDVHPGTLVPVVRVGANGIREMVMATWGMPSPLAYVKNYDFGVTNIRNTSSPHWPRWLGPANRCVVPFMSCAEPNPAAKVAGGRTPNVWFARNPERPVMFFAGLWTPWRGVKRVRDGERDNELFRASKGEDKRPPTYADEIVNHIQLCVGWRIVRCGTWATETCLAVGAIELAPLANCSADRGAGLPVQRQEPRHTGRWPWRLSGDGTNAPPPYG